MESLYSPAVSNILIQYFEEHCISNETQHKKTDMYLNHQTSVIKGYDRAESVLSSKQSIDRLLEFIETISKQNQYPDGFINTLLNTFNQYQQNCVHKHTFNFPIELQIIKHFKHPLYTGIIRKNQKVRK